MAPAISAIKYPVRVLVRRNNRTFFQTLVFPFLKGHGLDLFQHHHTPQQRTQPITYHHDVLRTLTQYECSAHSALNLHISIPESFRTRVICSHAYPEAAGKVQVAARGGDAGPSMGSPSGARAVSLPVVASRWTSSATSKSYSQWPAS